jgi:hypothetical protein
MMILSRRRKLDQDFAPGFLPGVLGGMDPEMRQRMPSIGFPSSNRVTLQREISPREERSEIEARTDFKGIPVATAISESKR